MGHVADTIGKPLFSKKYQEKLASIYLSIYLSCAQLVELLL